MMVSWVIESRGAGTSTVHDVEQAARALHRALLSVFADLGADELASVLTRVVAPVRMAMVTEGRAALARGEEWSIHHGGLIVTLFP